ncbi:tyrosine-type recombinase/integrase [Fusobacterium nucleatum]|uniref:tyrosine-type recombinase/integrase n=1 Tax=Fusobacterium nucleatum TaxID=851 RepID=UPI00235FFD7B|nr:site-specific integrase [Fusobacterium nucleatum]WDD89094.1 site-specific integrase [Fusobacterium nucleatum]
MKNQNGLGTVTKLKGKRRKSWAVRISYQNDTGVMKRKYLGYFETKKEAQEVLYNYNKNPLLFSGKTFKEISYLWFTSVKEKLTISSIKKIEIILKFFTILDEYKISDIKLFQLQKIFDEMTFSYNYKGNCKSVLNRIFDFAVKNDFIESNKVKFVELGKKNIVIERKIFTKNEINILWKNLEIKNVYLILILIYTGMRVGELLNLKVADVDLCNKVIYIRKSKTDAGVRTIPIPNKMLSLFTDNICYENEYFIFTKTFNQMSYMSFRYIFESILRKVGLQKHTIHDTRHTFATLLNNADANKTSIIKLIGHSDFSTTENVYTHKDIEELRKAINLLN